MPKKLGVFGLPLKLIGVPLKFIGSVIDGLLKPFIDGATVLVDKIVTGLWHGILDAGKGIIGGLKEIFKGRILKGIGSIIKGIGKGILGAGKSIVKGIVSAGKAVWNGVKKVERPLEKQLKVQVKPLERLQRKSGMVLKVYLRMVDIY